MTAALALTLAAVCLVALYFAGEAKDLKARAAELQFSEKAALKALELEQAARSDELHRVKAEVLAYKASLDAAESAIAESNDPDVRRKHLRELGAVLDKVARKP